MIPFFLYTDVSPFFSFCASQLPVCPISEKRPRLLCSPRPVAAHSRSRLRPLTLAKLLLVFAPLSLSRSHAVAPPAAPLTRERADSPLSSPLSPAAAAGVAVAVRKMRKAGHRLQ